MNMATLNKDHDIFSTVSFHIVSLVTKKLFSSFPSMCYMFMKSEFVQILQVRSHIRTNLGLNNVDGCYFYSSVYLSIKTHKGINIYDKEVFLDFFVCQKNITNLTLWIPEKHNNIQPTSQRVLLLKNYLVLQREKERIPKCFEFGLVIFKDKKICFGNYLWVCLLEVKWRIETIVQILQAFTLSGKHFQFLEKGRKR